MKYVYATALKSLRQYPLPLMSGKSCNILKGFGVTLCTRLDERLQRHIEQHGPLPTVGAGNHVEIGAANSKPKPKPSGKRRSPRPEHFVVGPPSPPPPVSPPAGPTELPESGRKSAEYMPRPGTGAFALLVTLRQHELEDDYPGFLRKSALQEAAQPLCSASFTLPDAGGYYTAWSTMSTLIKKKLVCKEGSPARFSLTPAGRQLADRLRAAPAAAPDQRHCFDRLDSGTAAAPAASPADRGTSGDPSAAVSSRLQYRYISWAGTQVQRKDEAHVSLDGGQVGFLVCCRRLQLEDSGLRYWADPSRAERDGVVHVFLADPDCAETCPSGPLPEPGRDGARTAGGAPTRRAHDMSDSSGERSPLPASQAQKRCATDWAAALKRLRSAEPAAERPTPPAGEAILMSSGDSDDDADDYGQSPAAPAPADEPVLLSDSGGDDDDDDDDVDDGGGGGQSLAARAATGSGSGASAGSGSRDGDSDWSADRAGVRLAAESVLPGPVPPPAPPVTGERQPNRPLTAAEIIRERSAAAAEARARGRPAAGDGTRERPAVGDDTRGRPVAGDDTRRRPVAGSGTMGCPAGRDDTRGGPAAEAQRPAPSVVLPPDTFDVVLCVDNQETSGKSGVGSGGCLRSYRDVVLAELQKNGVVADVRKLSVGDFLWVARPRTGKQPEELVLPYVVERKRLDDLASSIRDSRYREQKFRLRRCGITNIVYLAEGMGSGSRAQSVRLPESTLQQALVNCQVVDGFRVKWTTDQRETAAFLTLMTRRLQRQYQHRQLEGCPRHLLPASGDAGGQPQQLQLFSEFHQLSAKRQRLTAGDLFAKMLLQLAGLSTDKAAAIVSAYPSLARLRDGYSGCRSAAEAEALLAPLRASRSGRPVGAAVSRAVYHLYCDQQLV